MTYAWYDLIGNIGIVLILGAYLGLQAERLSAHDWRYSALNGLGAALILVSLIFAFNLSAFIIEVLWLIISVFGLYKSMRPRKS